MDTTKHIVIYAILLWLINYVYASPRVIILAVLTTVINERQTNNRLCKTLHNVKQNLPIPNPNFNATRAAPLAISEESYVDFDPAAASTTSYARPNICTDCVCGISNRKMRIVGGNVTEVHEFPWMVTMSRRGKFYCAGSLITRKHVLTAAHCMEGFNAKDIQIVLGEHDRSMRGSSVINRRIKTAYLHENFNAFSFNNDIALLELDIPVPFNGIVRPACLPENRDIDYTGATAVAAGWGYTNERDIVSDELRKVSLPILSDEECRTAGYDKKRLTDNMFCAGYLEGKRDACQGDSGGPLHITGTFGHLEVIGIISWGRGCARPQFPGIYTKLTNYLGWLRDHLGEECVCPPPTAMTIDRH